VGGALGVPRDWFASVGIDRAAKLAWAGGYVGDGVGASNLAGRTLADLLRGKHGETTELTELPWVGHLSPRWEPSRPAGSARTRPAGDEQRRRRGGAHRQAVRRAALFGRFSGIDMVLGG